MDMWEAATIGEGNRGTTWVKVFRIPGDHLIYENSSSYTVAGLLLNAELVIFKNTFAGKTMTESIDRGDDLDSLMLWLNGLLLCNVDPEVFMTKIDEARREAFEIGCMVKAS